MVNLHGRETESRDVSQSSYALGHTHDIGTHRTELVIASASRLMMTEQRHSVREGCPSCLEKANLEKRLSLVEEEEKRSRENGEHLLSSLKLVQRERVGFMLGRGRWV